ncbi:MAG: hypothetical protein WEK74_00795 [Hydrogenophaga sp.]
MRAQGYIRLALAFSGVHVSNATLQREVVRASKASSDSRGLGSGARPDELPPALTPLLGSAPTAPTHAPQSPCVASVQTGMRSSKEIAEAFASS